MTLTFKNDEYLKNNDNKFGLIDAYELKGKIRNNEELQYFVISLFNRNKTLPTKYNYENIEVVYARDTKELNEDIQYFRKKGYVSINFSKSNKLDTPFDYYIEDKDTHHVIGLEFDNVVIPLNDTFFYNEKKRLAAKKHSNPDYLYTQLFYQAVTRARKKLALVIGNAPELYSEIISIFKRE